MSTALRSVDPELVVRPLRASDLAQVMAIEQASFSTPWRDTTFAGLLERGDADLFGAEQAGRLVGYAVCWIILDQSELGNVAVAPDARGLGVGRRLVEAVLARVRERGAKECFLEVANRMPARRRFIAHLASRRWGGGGRTMRGPPRMRW